MGRIITLVDLGNDQHVAATILDTEDDVDDFVWVTPEDIDQAITALQGLKEALAPKAVTAPEPAAPTLPEGFLPYAGPQGDLKRGDVLYESLGAEMYYGGKPEAWAGTVEVADVDIKGDVLVRLPEVARHFRGGHWHLETPESTWGKRGGGPANDRILGVKRAGRWVKFDGNYLALKVGDKVRVELVEQEGYVEEWQGETSVTDICGYGHNEPDRIRVSVDSGKRASGFDGKWWLEGYEGDRVTEVWVP